MTTSSIAPVARPIPGHNRLTGELVALVPSCSQPNVCHIVTATSCSCKGFQYRRACRHVARPANDIRDGGAAHLAVQRAAGNWPTVSPEVAAKAAAYHSIFGSDE